MLVFSLLLLGGYYFHYLFHQPKLVVDFGKNEVQQLNKDDILKEGDILFQTSMSPQSKAIQIATHSKYSHCGLLFHQKENSKDWFVLEAIQPVKWTSLEDWIARGQDGHYVVKRLKANTTLPASSLLKLRSHAEKYLGKNYDLTFEWSDKKIYCSELVWKAYQKTTGIELGHLQKLADFDLSNKIVKSKLIERYGKRIPLDETVISPQAIFESDLLKTIKEK